MLQHPPGLAAELRGWAWPAFPSGAFSGKVDATFQVRKRDKVKMKSAHFDAVKI
jgi:hypothetical protein